MASMDLHPEDLLEREAAGELTQDDRARLGMHLRHCAACRMERRVRADFERIADSPAGDVRALITNALVPERARATRPAGRHRVARLGLPLVAAVLLGLGGLAAASIWARQRVAWHQPVDKGAPAMMSETRVRVGRVGPTEAESPPREVASSERSAVPPTVATALEFPKPSAARRPVRATTAPNITPPVSPASNTDAAALFGEANTARREGDHEGAAVAYRQLIARYPQSAEAHESPAVLGRMLLDDGDGAGALRCFDEYVGRGGVLMAEALLGRALALQQLGRVSEERTAWTALVAAYPESVHASRARTRLAKLER